MMPDLRWYADEAKIDNNVTKDDPVIKKNHFIIIIIMIILLFQSSNNNVFCINLKLTNNLER